MLQEILLVLDGTTGLNMLAQAREFNDVNISEALVLAQSFAFRSTVSLYLICSCLSRHNTCYAPFIGRGNNWLDIDKT